uniref:AMP-activated protein kinase glycogen-binding domain-containing protein n=1 Tax=Chenopodium quinoa TaxID=63459 RepID=A0A803MUF9_CHEQI
MSLCNGLISSSIWSTDFTFNGSIGLILRRTNRNRISRVFAMSKDNQIAYKMNLNEYMVTLDKPLGIRFALSVDGKGNAEKSRIIMVGDTLKKAGDSSDGQFLEIKDISDAQSMLKEKVGSFSLVLERPFSPFSIEELLSMNDLDILFNRGRVPVATWSKTLVASALQGSSESGGNSGFVVFSSKFLVSRAWKMLTGQNENGYLLSQYNSFPASLTQLVCISVEEDSTDAEWSHGSFPLGEYTKAIDRSKGEIYYTHSLGMQYSKITEQLYVGSCIQGETDVEALASLGITAILNFQSLIEAENWGINSNSIKECCQKCDILMINYPIRVFVTCTSGFDRSPACVIAYLHWMMDTSLNAAYNFVTGLHTCRPNRPAIAWATWDLIAMVDKDKQDRPATHAVIFVWNGHEGEDVYLVGDFTGNWKDPIKAVHKGGPRYEIEVRLPQGKYYYKYIVNGQWRHSMTSPTERDESGNVNNIIVIGDTAIVIIFLVSLTASFDFYERQWNWSFNFEPLLLAIPDANIVKVIERHLTENERFMLAKAARCIAFSICPIRLVPK